MDHLVKQKLNTEKVAAWFIRMQRSVENTMKDILREQMPMALDNPDNQKTHMDTLEEKRKRDRLIEESIRKASY
jgi:hypothetical protein